MEISVAKPAFSSWEKLGLFLLYWNLFSVAAGLFASALKMPGAYPWYGAPGWLDGLLTTFCGASFVLIPISVPLEAWWLRRRVAYWWVGAPLAVMATIYVFVILLWIHIFMGSSILR